MSTFVRSSAFNAKAYAAFRPTYPKQVYQAVLAYHKLPTPAGTLLDIGCGPGAIARELAPHFRRVVAVDPSAKMVEQARSSTAATSGSDKISFHAGGAEDLGAGAIPGLGAGTVDMAVAGQAAHWFDYGRAWPELARAVRGGGTLAFWGYVDNVLVGAEAATAVMERFVYGAQGDGDDAGVGGMGPYWEQPGRNILRGLLRSVRPPEADWTDVRRLEHEPGRIEGEGEGEGAAPGPSSSSSSWLLRQRMKLGEVEAYTRTFSCFHAWKDAHPDAVARADGGPGDIVDIMWDHMRDAVPEWKALGEGWREAEVLSDWGTYLLLARRR